MKTYCNRLDCDTLDMVIEQIVNMAQFFRYFLDTNIRLVLVHILAQILEIILQMADELYKLLYVLDLLNALVR